MNLTPHFRHFVFVDAMSRRLYARFRPRVKNALQVCVPRYNPWRIMPDFSIESALGRPAPGCAELTLRGGVSTAGTMQLHGGLQNAIDAGVRVLVINLTAVPQMSSAPISALVAASEQLRVLGGIVILAGLAPKLKVIFDALGLGDAFCLAVSMEAGRATASKHAAALARAPYLASTTGLQVAILEAPVTIGSDPKNTIVVPHPQVEPKHAVVTLRGAVVVLRDLGSRTGTFVAGKRIREQVLTPGTAFTIGSMTWTLKTP